MGMRWRARWWSSIFIAAALIWPVTSAYAQQGESSQGEKSIEVSAKPQAAAAPEVNPMWLDRMAKDDRAFVDENIGYAPPAMPTDLKWVGVEPMSWKELRGKVVVVQSWTSRNAAGRRVPERLEEARKNADSDEAVFIALHTPEGADHVETYLERRPVEGIVAVDGSGAFCDALGFYRRPTNVVIDRNGEVRFAGLRVEYLADAVKALLAETADDTKQPKEHPAPPTTGDTAFPKTTGAIKYAKDIRNQRAPEFQIAQWVNSEAHVNDRVVVIDFWATWCGPCVAAIPHMNELADEYRADVVCIGISDEKPADFQRGMQKLKAKNITLQSFRYHVALDPQKRMSKEIAIRGIPHVIVMSSDWVVRWQGHPTQLDKGTLEQIIAANKALNESGAGRNRWAKSMK